MAAGAGLLPGGWVVGEEDVDDEFLGEVADGCGFGKVLGSEELGVELPACWLCLNELVAEASDGLCELLLDLLRCGACGEL